MIYIFIVIFLILIMYVIPCKLQFYYEFTDSSKYKISITYLFGLIKFNFDSTSKKDKDRTKNKESTNYMNYMKYFIDKGSVEKVYFRINLGFEDPSLLGISMGLVWSIINLCFGYFLRNIDIDKIKEKDIQVIPLFDCNIFELYFLCIINVNLVYIITAYIKILKEKKGGDSVARASNRRINENYNE